VPNSWFGTFPTVSVQFSVNSGAFSSCSASLIHLYSTVSTPTLVDDVLVELPQSTLFPNDVFTVPIVADTSSPLTAFNIKVKFSAGLSFSSVAYDVSTWYLATTVSSTSVVFTGQVLHFSSVPAPTILTLTFTVLPSASTEHLNATVVQLVSDFGQDILPGGRAYPAAANILDRNGVSFSGSVFVSATVQTGMYAFPAVGQILNTAPLDGVALQVPITSLAAWSNGSVITARQLSCSVDNSAAVSLSQGCTSLVFDGTQTSSGVVHVQITSFGVTTTFSVTVWLPSAATISVTDATLNLLDMTGLLAMPGCQAHKFQSTNVYLGVTFSSGSNTSPSLDFTSSLANLIASSAPGVASLSGSTLTGVSVGSTSVSFTSTHGSVAASTSVAVSNTPVYPTRLDASVVTSVSVSAQSQQSTATQYSGTATANTGSLTSYLQLGYVAVSAVITDGTRLVLGPSDGISLSTTDPTAVATTALQQVQARSSTTGTTVNVDWTSTCGTGSFNVLQTSLSVVATVPAPSSVTVTVGSAVTAVGDAASLSPASVPTSLNVQVTVLFSDGSSRDVPAMPIQCSCSRRADPL